jgi:transcriptional regulator with XRE-family HTH domain
MRRPLPAAEREIGARLRQWRSESLIPRAILARKIGVGSERLASYEAGRAPLRFGVFLALWKSVHLNPGWLATGEGPRTVRFEGFEEAVRGIGSTMRFSDAYEERLRAVFEHAEVKLLTALNKSEESLDLLLSRLGGEDPTVRSEGIRELREMLLRDAITKEGIIFSRTLALPKLEEIVMSGPMFIDGELLLGDLRRRLKDATAARGMKKRLADSFGVTQPTVTEWINGPAKPSAENTLALLEWVKDAERKLKKSPTVVSARPGRRMTRKSKSKSHEKTKSSRPKR